MDMPSIDNVKAAAEFVLREDVDLNRYENMRDFCESATTLAKSLSAVLSAPGMSAERLAEIQRIAPNAEADSEHGWNALEAVPELLAEVIRLRAQHEPKSTVQDVIDFLNAKPVPAEVLDAIGEIMDAFPPPRIVTQEPSCSTCRFWRASKHDLGDDTAGVCRRNAPQPIASVTRTIADLLDGDDDDESRYDGADTYASWPATNADDWCGEYQQRT